MPDSPSTTPDPDSAATGPRDAPESDGRTPRPGTESPVEAAATDASTVPGDALPRQYRWTCPLCGETRLTLVTVGKRESHVVNDLRSHVRAATGSGHGPSGSEPRGLDATDLGRHVRRMD